MLCFLHLYLEPAAIAAMAAIAAIAAAAGGEGSSSMNCMDLPRPSTLPVNN